MTAIGAIDLERSHGYCKGCEQPQYAADRLLGIDGWLTPRARAMADRAGISDPFRQAEVLLKDLAGWSVDAETIRRCRHQDAKAAREARPELQALPEAFAQARAEGEDQEPQIDAGKVNTPDGWRDVKLAVFACRERGEPATSEEYEQREPPEPSVRSVVAEVEEAQEFGRRCQGEAVRLGVLSRVEGVLVLVAGLSVLGDGAEWIWNLASQIFVGAAQALDVYHGCEKLAEAGRAALGEEGRLQAWLDEARAKLVGDGYFGVCEVMAGLSADAEMAARLGATGGEVLNYFCGHQERLGYAARLRRGQAIGSGLVEGTIKQRVNVRMKRSGARWLAKHAGPFVELMAMADTPEWSEFWILTAA